MWRPLAPMRASNIAMVCDWDAMLMEQCAPSDDELRSLADDFSPTFDAQWQRRESVRLLSVNPAMISIEEILCQDHSCIAIAYDVPRQGAIQAMERYASGAARAAKHAALDGELREMVSMLNQSPSIIKGMARRYAHDLRPTDTLESATVAAVDGRSLTVEVVAIDLMEMGGSGGRMPRRSHTVIIPLPRSC